MDLSLTDQEYKRVMDKQDLLDSKTQEFCALNNSLLRADILTRMQHDLVYQAAYKSNDLLSMWSALENLCATGSTKSVQNRIQAKFMKLYQQDNMSYNEYVTTFSSKLKQLKRLTLPIPTPLPLNSLFRD
jgi:hypothetical protein